MPSAPYRLSCNTEKDLDIIQFLDTFTSRERSVVLKKIIRDSWKKDDPNEQLEEILNSTSRIFKLLAELKKSGVTTKEAQDLQEELSNIDISEAEKNILSLFNQG